MDANPEVDDEDDLDFLEEGYVKDDSSKKQIMIRRETGIRLPVINHHHQMEGVDHDQEKKKAGNNIGGRKGLSSSSGGSSSTGSAGSMKCCQADKCTAELTDAKQYHRRHKVCEYHSKAQVVIVGGIRQRFCQQCSRFHEVSEFDESKRSCRRRLAGHNERRRKSTVAETTTQAAAAEGSGGGGGKSQTKEMVDDRGRIQINIQENSSTNFKHFQIR